MCDESGLPRARQVLTSPLLELRAVSEHDQVFGVGKRSRELSVLRRRHHTERRGQRARIRRRRTAHRRAAHMIGRPARSRIDQMGKPFSADRHAPPVVATGGDSAVVHRHVGERFVVFRHGVRIDDGDGIVRTGRGSPDRRRC